MGNKKTRINHTMIAKERMSMKKGTSGFVKGIGTGVAVGIAASVAGTVMYNNNKAFKKKANKAVKAVTGIVQDVQSMMK